LRLGLGAWPKAKPKLELLPDLGIGVNLEEPVLPLGRNEGPFLRAFVEEEVLLSPAGVGAEVVAGEMSQLAGGDALVVGEIDAAQGTFDPDIDGEGVVESAGEEEGAVGDFLADAGEFYQFFQSALVFHRGQGIEVELTAIDQACGGEEVLRAKAEFAVPELFMGRAGDGGDGGKGMMRVVNRFAKALRQQTDDLADLDNLFGRAGNERGETFPGFLADDAQAVVVFGGLAKERVFGECGEDVCERDVEGEVTIDGDGRWAMVEWRNNVPVQLMWGRLSQAPNCFANDAFKPAVGITFPAEGLAAFERTGEIEIRNIDSV